MIVYVVLDCHEIDGQHFIGVKGSLEEARDLVSTVHKELYPEGYVVWNEHGGCTKFNASGYNLEINGFSSYNIEEHEI